VWLLENRGLTDPAEIEQALRFGEYIKNGAHMITHLPSTSFDIFIIFIDSLYVRITLVRWAIYRNACAILPPQIPPSETTIRHFLTPTRRADRIGKNSVFRPLLTAAAAGKK